MQAVFEWLNTWAAIPLAILAFALTIWQVVKAKNAAEAARDAAFNAESLLSKNQLILLIPILHRAESDLENAIEGNERRLAAYHLSSWRWFGSQLRTYLNSESPEDRKVAKALQTSIALAADAKLETGDQSRILAEICRPALQAIAAVTGELGRIAAAETKKVSA